MVTYKRSGYVPKKKKLIIYLARLVRDIEIKTSEHEDYEWFDWNPPHSIQEKTIDPLLKKLAKHWQESEISG